MLKFVLSQINYIISWFTQSCVRKTVAKTKVFVATRPNEEGEWGCILFCEQSATLCVQEANWDECDSTLRFFTLKIRSTNVRRLVSSLLIISSRWMNIVSRAYNYIAAKMDYFAVISCSTRNTDAIYLEGKKVRIQKILPSSLHE